MFKKIAEDWLLNKETEDLAKSIIAHTQHTMIVENWVPAKWTALDKENYYLEQFNLSYKWMLENNPPILVDFIWHKHDREAVDAKLWIIDEKDWKLKSEFMQYFLNELLLKKAIDNWDLSTIKATFNPLVKSTKYESLLIENKDKTTNHTALNVVNRVANYIKWTYNERTPWESADMLAAIIQYNLDWYINLYRKEEKLWDGITEWMKTFIDNVFYTESLLSDYIMDLETWMDSIQWWAWWTAPKLAALKATYKDIAKKVDGIRDWLKGNVKVQEYKQIPFMVNRAEKSIFKAQPIESYKWQTTSSLFGNDVTGWQPKDINRKIKPSKDFKFKE